jgi:hypothetical protein
MGDGFPALVHRGSRSIAARIEDANSRELPLFATLSCCDPGIAQSHGFMPLSVVSATCWMQHVRTSHGHGWRTALSRLRSEARAAAIPGGARQGLSVGAIMISSTAGEADAMEILR